MDINRLIESIEEIVPLYLALPGDEIGVVYPLIHKLVNYRVDVEVVGVTWELTLMNLKLMLRDGVEFIVCHEDPFIRRSIGSVLWELGYRDKIPNKLMMDILDTQRIVVYRMHTNLDNSEIGTNSELAKKLGLKDIKNYPVSRVGRINECSLKEFVELVKKKLSCKFLLISGDLDKVIKKVMVVAGAGLRHKEFFELAYKEGVDVIVSAELDERLARYAQYLNIAIIDAGHYETEVWGVKRFNEELKNKIGNEVQVKFYENVKSFTVLF